MESGTFGRGLMAFAKALTVLAEDVRALVASPIYGQRLVRCLSHPRNREALGDFLALDNICLDLYGLVGEEDKSALFELKKKVFEVARFGVAFRVFSDERVEKLWTHLLYRDPAAKSPEKFWRKMGWK